MELTLEVLAAGIIDTEPLLEAASDEDPFDYVEHARLGLIPLGCLQLAHSDPTADAFDFDEAARSLCLYDERALPAGASAALPILAAVPGVKSLDYQGRDAFGQIDHAVVYYCRGEEWPQARARFEQALREARLS